MSPSFNISYLRRASWSVPVSDWLEMESIGVGKVPLLEFSNPVACMGAGMYVFPCHITVESNTFMLL